MCSPVYGIGIFCIFLNSFTLTAAIAAIAAAFARATVRLCVCAFVRLCACTYVIDCGECMCAYSNLSVHCSWMPPPAAGTALPACVGTYFVSERKMTLDKACVSVCLSVWAPSLLLVWLFSQPFSPDTV